MKNAKLQRFYGIALDSFSCLSLQHFAASTEAFLHSDQPALALYRHHCPKCAKPFRYEQSVRRHIEAVHEKLSYVCDIEGCTKTFAYQTSLFHHRRSHKLSGE